MTVYELIAELQALPEKVKNLPVYHHDSYGDWMEIRVVQVCPESELWGLPERVLI